MPWKNKSRARRYKTGKNRSRLRTRSRRSRKKRYSGGADGSSPAVNRGTKPLPRGRRRTRIISRGSNNDLPPVGMRTGRQTDHRSAQPLAHTNFPSQDNPVALPHSGDSDDSGWVTESPASSASPASPAFDARTPTTDDSQYGSGWKTIDYRNASEIAWIEGMAAAAHSDESFDEERTLYRNIIFNLQDRSGNLEKYIITLSHELHDTTTKVDQLMTECDKLSEVNARLIHDKSRLVRESIQSVDNTEKVVAVISENPIVSGKAAKDFTLSAINPSMRRLFGEGAQTPQQRFPPRLSPASSDA